MVSRKSVPRLALDRRVFVGLCVFFFGGLALAAGPVCKNGSCRLPPVVRTDSSGSASTVKSSASPVDLSAVAAARCRALAASRSLPSDHRIPGAPGIPAGVGEGIGRSTDVLDVPTCILPGDVVADCTVRGDDGYFYRVRFFSSSEEAGRESFLGRSSGRERPRSLLFWWVRRR